jgi:hypothetical protein
VGFDRIVGRNDKWAHENLDEVVKDVDRKFSKPVKEGEKEVIEVDEEGNVKKVVSKGSDRAVRETHGPCYFFIAPGWLSRLLVTVSGCRVRSLLLEPGLRTMLATQ